MTSISKKAIVIQLLVFLLFIILICVFGIPLIINFLPKFKNITLIISIILTCILSIICFIYPFLYYKTYKYIYNNKDIFIKYGIFIKHEVTIPTTRLQDVQLIAGPILQIFNLKKIIISTAGSNFKINYLSSKASKELVEHLEDLLSNKVENKKTLLLEKVKASKSSKVTS
ncbi:MAG: PH domain-containing protein [Anaeroplasmataceae bacterium]